MLINSVKHLHLDCSGLISVKGSPGGHFIGILTPRELRIQRSQDLNGEVLSLFKLDDKDFAKCGKNTWMTWNTENSLTILTQKNSYFYITINKNGKFMTTTLVDMESEITGVTALKGYCVFATKGPKIHAISNDGHFLGTVNFEESATQDIVSMEFIEKFAFVVFRDGTVGTSNVKFTDVFDLKDSKITMLIYTDVKSTGISSDSNYISLLHNNGDLALISNGTGSFEEEIICRNVSKFCWCKQASYIFILTFDNELVIINANDRTKTVTKLDFEFNISSCSMDYNIDFISLMISDDSDLHILYLATTDWYVPSFVFHTYESIFILHNKRKIKGPESIISKGFTIQCAASTDDGKHVVISGIRGFALYDAMNDTWIFSADRFNKCKGIWYQCGFFVSVLHDSKTGNYKIALLTVDALTIVDSFVLPGLFNFITYRDGKVLVATNEMISVFLISKTKIKQIMQSQVNGRVMGAAIIDNGSVIAAQINSELQMFPAGTVEKKNVVSMKATTNSNLYFIKYSDSQEFRYNNSHEKIDVNIFFIHGIFTYHLPLHYEIGEMRLKRVPFLAKVLMKMENADDRFMLIQPFLKDEFIVVELVRAYHHFIDAGRGDEFMGLISRLEIIRSHILLAALILLPEEYHEKIKAKLPELKVLQREFPYLKEKILSLYEQN